MDTEDGTVPAELGSLLEGPGEICVIRFSIGVATANVHGCGLVIFNTETGDIIRVLVHLGPDKDLSQVELDSTVKGFEADIIEKQFSGKVTTHLVNDVSESIFHSLNNPGSALRAAIIINQDIDIRRAIAKEITSRIEDGDVQFKCRVDRVTAQFLDMESDAKENVGAAAYGAEAETIVLDAKPSVSPVKGAQVGMLSPGCIISVTLADEKAYFAHFAGRGVEPGAAIQTRIISIEPGSTGRTRIVTNLGNNILGTMQVNPDIRIRALKPDGTEFPMVRAAVVNQSFLGLDPAVVVPGSVLLVLIGFLLIVGVYFLN